MIPRIPSLTRRLVRTAFATALLVGSLAGATSAASPAGDDLDADFDGKLRIVGCSPRLSTRRMTPEARTTPPWNPPPGVRWPCMITYRPKMTTAG